MHPHTLAHATPVTGVRFNAPWGPTSRKVPIKPCRVRRYVTLDKARFDYWWHTGEVWRHKRPPIMPIMGGANLYSGDDANFDGGTIGGWVVNTNCTLTTTTAQQQAGTRSLQVTATAAGAFGALSPEVTIVVGTSYFASVYSRTAVTARPFGVDLAWYNSAHTFLSSTSGALSADTTSGWTKVNVTATAPATAVYARIFVNYGNSAAGEVHYIDTASLDTTTPGETAFYFITGTFRAASIAVDGFDIIEVRASCRGGGGGGGTNSGLAGITPGAGGGGGAFASGLVTTTPNTVYTVTVGQGGAIATNGGDSWFSTTGTVFAHRGGGATNNTPGTGGTTASSIGTTEFKGGEGGAGSGVTGGGGGGGAGDANAGGNASGTTAGTGGAAGGGAGGAQNTAGTVNSGAGGGAAAATGTAGVGARGRVDINPTKFRVENNVITEHVITVPRLLIANRAFSVITEHVLARTLNVKITHPVITEHVVAQGAKSIVKTAFPIITEHVMALTRQLVALRSFAVITEHVTALTRTLVLARSFPVITEHVTALTRRLVATRSFPVITEHDLTLTRRLVASRTFAVITEHEVAFARSLVASRTFNVITEHVTLLNRQLGLQRVLDVITEHEMSFTKVVTFDRKFSVITEHVVTAQVAMDFDDVPGGACPPCEETDVWGVAG